MTRGAKGAVLASYSSGGATGGANLILRRLVNISNLLQ